MIAFVLAHPLETLAISLGTICAWEGVKTLARIFF